MKNQVNTHAFVALKNTVATAFIALLLIANTANANTREKGTEKAAVPAPVAIKYLGMVNSHPVFQMDIDNALEDELYVSLKDEDGDILYGEKVKGRKFSKKFQFANSDAHNLRVTLNLSSKKYSKPQVYEIANVSKVVEDVVVTQL